VEADEFDLLGLEEKSGELETRFKLLGCRGVWGIEFDLRRVLRADALTRSFEVSFFRGGGALMASLRDLRVALMTSVANIDLSFADNFSPSLFSSANTTFFPLVLAAGAFPPFALATIVDFEAGFVVLGSVIFGNKRSFNNVTFAGVQVDVEPTAARIESTRIWKTAIMIHTKFAVLLKNIHHPEFARASRMCKEAIMFDLLNRFRDSADQHD
jgi:hypothetical protein